MMLQLIWSTKYFVQKRRRLVLQYEFMNKMNHWINSVLVIKFNKLNHWIKSMIKLLIK